MLAITITRIRKQRMLRTFLFFLSLLFISSHLPLLLSPVCIPKIILKFFISVVFNRFCSASLHLQSNVCLPKQGSSQRSILPIRLQEIGVRISFGHSPLPAGSNNLFIVPGTSSTTMTRFVRSVIRKQPFNTGSIEMTVSMSSSARRSMVRKDDPSYCLG